MNDLKQAQKSYLLAMDNNCFYFSASVPFVTQISSVDKNNFSVEQDVLTYNFDVEYDLSTSKRTYCGHYVAFPCSGSPSDKCVTLRALVGKSGEPQKCILEQPTSAISVCVSELSNDEIVFLCSGENRGIFNIYRYAFGEEQAQLIFTAELDVASQNSNPLISCCNGDIYFIYRSAENKTDYCIKQLDADGNICDEMLLSLPEHYDTSLGEFTVTENNFLIRFFPDDDFGYFQTVLINRKTNEIFSDSGDNKLGVRFNDGMTDGRYIIFRAGSKSVSEHPMICVFDDWNSEFNFIEFTEIDSSEIINTVANDDGDIVFFTHEGDERFVTMYRPDCVTRTFQRILKRHKLPEMRFHDLRHSTASILFDKGWDLEAVKAWLRHADIETTSNIYLHISKDRKHLLAADLQGTFIAPIFENEYDVEISQKRMDA